jgi:hypothetical protein
VYEGKLIQLRVQVKRIELDLTNRLVLLISTGHVLCVTVVQAGLQGQPICPTGGVVWEEKDIV